MITRTTHVGQKVRWFTCSFCGLEMKGVAQNMDSDELIPCCPNCLEPMSEIIPECNSVLDDMIADGVGSEIVQTQRLPEIEYPIAKTEKVSDQDIASSEPPSVRRVGRPASPKCKTCSHAIVVDDRGEKNYKCKVSGEVHAAGASCKLWQKKA